MAVIVANATDPDDSEPSGCLTGSYTAIRDQISLNEESFEGVSIELKNCQWRYTSLVLTGHLSAYYPSDRPIYTDTPTHFRLAPDQLQIANGNQWISLTGVEDWSQDIGCRGAVRSTSYLLATDLVNNHHTLLQDKVTESQSNEGSSDCELTQELATHFSGKLLDSRLGEITFATSEPLYELINKPWAGRLARNYPIDMNFSTAAQLAMNGGDGTSATLNFENIQYSSGSNRELLVAALSVVDKQQSKLVLRSSLDSFIKGSWISLADSDSDSDGMPDTWETLYNLDPFDSEDASSDMDFDGFTAIEELAGFGNPQIGGLNGLLFDRQIHVDARIFSSSSPDAPLGYGIVSVNTHQSDEHRHGSITVTLNYTGAAHWVSEDLPDRCTLSAESASKLICVFDEDELNKPSLNLRFNQTEYGTVTFEATMSVPAYDAKLSNNTSIASISLSP